MLKVKVSAIDEKLALSVFVDGSGTNSAKLKVT